MDEYEMDDYKAIESGKDYLSHYGVKGMKWGIRHDPEPSGNSRSARKLGKAVHRTAKAIARGLKKASKTSVKTARRAKYKAQQRKIEKAIASGNATRINKIFSKMNDQQVARAVNRINQREAVLRAKVEDGKRSLKNINMQRKIDSLNLQNQYNKAKHPNLYRAKDNAVDNGSKIVGNRLGNAMADALITMVKKVSEHPEAITRTAEKAAEVASKAEKPSAPFDTSNAIDVPYKIKHSDFVDLGEDFLSHHGVKGMKWGIRHDENRVSSLELKKTKNQARLDKAKGKKAKFNMKHRSLTARKAEIRMAKGKDPGLLGHLALAKSKKLDYKIAKLERKDAKLNKKITNAKADLDYSKAKDRFRQETVRLGKEKAAFIKANNSLTKSPVDKLSNMTTANQLRLIGQYKAARQLRDAKLNKIAIKKGKNSISYKLGQWDAKRNTEWYGNTKIHKNKDGVYELTSYYVY